ncbi:MAG: hypothetical protein Hals2KO_10840 [Halioglobus sp.]
MSPFDAERTEIARYSRMVVSVLEEECFVQVVDESGIVNGDFTLQDLNASPDIVNFYNLGNSVMHCGILDFALQTPGIVVLHDISLLELSLAYARYTGEFDIARMAADEYGHEAARAFSAMFGGENYSWHGRDQAQYDAFTSNYPLFESFIGNAMGVVVHSDYALRHVQARYKGPVVKLDLPYQAPESSPGARQHEEPFQIVFCGHAGPNRRLGEFLSAWSTVSRPEAFRLSLVGKIAKVDELNAHIAKLGLTEWVTIVGFVSDEELDQRLSQADLAINLRFPTMGEASASQLRYWSRGVPSIVSDVGWYGELPDDVAIKISPHNERQDIVTLLEEMIGGDLGRLACGARGEAFLRSQHNVERYVSGLLNFAGEALDRRFAAGIFDDRLIEILASMCDDVNDSVMFEPTLARLSSMVERL